MIVPAPLADVMVSGPDAIFRQLAKEWARKGSYQAETVMELQEALHALELSRAVQPLSIRITPPAGLVLA